MGRSVVTIAGLKEKETRGKFVALYLHLKLISDQRQSGCILEFCLRKIDG